ncbi:aliphatic sulfonate ABC transporter substrate-binding protein [Stenotrophomonas sp.]|uniref:aliphatic sulfonate ABC transporter substrate-binding protein n=1 Tax=Stenotrophomonas sp. TaxID=69392 RepID=UPI0028B10CFE|nr:aliphatic sulfonate ABC transporter substrate-binding protein [Stenotrophomonas sp.]
MTPALMTRRRLLQAGAAAAIAVPSLAMFTRGHGRLLRIGHQKGYLSLLRQRRTLEQRLAPLGVAVRWTEFPAGPVQLEALNAGAIDFGDVGEAPPIFAQAAGAPLAYIAASQHRPQAEAVVVPRHSPITRVQQLRGKRIALNKGSNVHYFIVKLFEHHGLRQSDLNLVYLSAADARAAFENGAIDAWVIWDPILAGVQRSLQARILADATGVAGNRAYYFSSHDYAAGNADILAIVIDDIRRIDHWAAANRSALAAELAALWGLPLPVSELAETRTTYGTVAITADILAEQQRIADTFLALKLIPRPVRIAEAATAIVPMVPL